MENFQCAAWDHLFNCSPSFSHGQHHETDAAEGKGGIWSEKVHEKAIEDEIKIPSAVSGTDLSSTLPKFTQCYK